MDFSTLTLERQGAVEILSLNRPDALNAMSPEMVFELRAYFEGLLGRLDVRVVLLRGEGRMFSAGADLGSVAFAEAGEGRAQRQMAMQKLYSGLVSRCAPARSRSSRSFMAQYAAAASRSRSPPTCVTPRPAPG